MTSPPLQPDEKRNSASDTANLGNNPYDESDFKERLSDEYKILQDKIDKIGAFRFTIKGWSITAVIAASAAASGKGLSTVFTISIGLVLMLAFFFWMEYEQVKWSRLFGNRAGRLEDAFGRIRRGKGAELYPTFPVPYTAHELVLASQRKTARGRSPQSPRRKNASVGWTDKWHASKQAHAVFYFVLIILAFAPLLAQHHAIGLHWKELKEKFIHTQPEAPPKDASCRPSPKEK